MHEQASIAVHAQPTRVRSQKEKGTLLARAHRSERERAAWHTWAASLFSANLHRQATHPTKRYLWT